MKRDRLRPNLKGGYEEGTGEAGAASAAAAVGGGGSSVTSRRRENRYAAPLGAAHASPLRKYTPPTFEAGQPSSVTNTTNIINNRTGSSLLRQTAQSGALLQATKLSTNHVISPRSDTNVDGVSTHGERPPSRVFFPRNNPGPLAMDDSLTIDSELDDPSSTIQSNSPTSPAVYHLARDGDIRMPSPKHRAKLEAWYRRNGDKVQLQHHQQHHQQQQLQQPQQYPLNERLPRDRSQDQPERNRRGRGINRDVSRSLSDEDDHSAYTGHSQMLSTVGSGDYPESLLSKEAMSEDDDYLRTKQEIAFLSIGITSIQLLTICLQFAMCGIAPLEVNPFVGPFPDAFSEWGGKNGYLMIVGQEYWRIISPCALSVGILHLLANAFCQLEPIAIFEREWGSVRWLLIYVLSSVGCNTLSVYVDPDTIAVGSSGSLMGLFAAKLAQVFTHTLFDVNKANQDEFIRLDQLSSVVCGLLIISVLSFFTFIDWSGHLGGLMAGFFSGMVLFSNPIRSCCIRFLWTFLGLSGLVVTLTGSIFLAMTETEPSADLADACYYFRNLYPEDKECGCFA